MNNDISTDRTARIYRLARLTLAGAWIYHGLVPKYLYRDWSEMTLLHDMGVEIQSLPSALNTAALVEMGFGLLILANWRSRWPLWGTIGAMLGALAEVAMHSPNLLHSAFNPVTLNGSLITLAVIALWSRPESKVAKVE